MTIYNTNVAKNYALSAGFNSAWSGIREIVQNALDGDDKGFHMSIHHGKARDRSGDWALKIVNEGISLTSDALVLGFSTKQGDNSQRGEHGEGLVVGINALLNFGHEVWIRTGDESWVAKHQTNNNGLEVLVIDIRKQPLKINDFIVEIKGITPSDWELYRTRLLFFENQDSKKLVLDNGTILLDPKYKNHLFVKGIYVCKMPGDYSFGYDLNIHLNRDREVADPWALKDLVRNVIMDAVERNLFTVDEILKVLENEGCGESQAFANATFWSGPQVFHKAIADNFIEKHGKEAMPVSSLGEGQRVEHFGKKGITVSRAVKNIIEKQVGELESRLEKRAFDLSKQYGWQDLSAEEKNNIIKLEKQVCDVENKDEGYYLNLLNVVDFIGENINGLAKVKKNDCDERELSKFYIARKILLDAPTFVETFVHEVAHIYGKDGDSSHEKNQLRILSEIITKNLL